MPFPSKPTFAPDLLASWPEGPGTMTSLVRNHDWSKTSLGSSSDWTHSLRTTVRLVLAAPEAMIVLWGPELVQIYNDGYSNVMGKKHPDGLGQPTRDCWPEVWHINQPIYESVSLGQAFTFEDRLYPITRHGYLEDAWFTISYSPLRDEIDQIAGVLVSLVETSARIRAEAERKATELRLEEAQNIVLTERKRLCEMFEQAPVFMAVLRGPEHIFEMVNPLYKAMIGGRDVIGRSVSQGLPEAEAQGYVAALDEVFRTGKPLVAHSHLIDLAVAPSGDTQRIYLDYVYQPMREPDGTTSGIIVLGVDVTGRVRAEEVLRTTEKLTAVGRLATSIAHEINNPLESVTNLLYLARNSTEMGEVQDYLAMAERELRRVSAITSQTLLFHRQSTSPRAVTFGDLIDSTVFIYQGRLVNSNITVERRQRCHRTIVCFSGEIRQVLSNLLSNAIDAMHPNGGRLLLRCRDGHEWSSGRAGLVITVADSGSGIGPATLKRIFEPFFTTKGMGGTGVGLWLSEQICKRHQGCLRVRSSQTVGMSGTAFTIFLPFDAAVRDA